MSFIKIDIGRRAHIKEKKRFQRKQPSNIRKFGNNAIRAILYLLKVLSDGAIMSNIRSVGLVKRVHENLTNVYISGV